MASSHDRQPSNGPIITDVPGAGPLDRRRIDSDVRELLRQPSTPWITFNRASRASHLAAGDLLPRRASVIDPGALAAAPAAAPVETSVTEPSGLAVASDVEPSQVTKLASPQALARGTVDDVDVARSRSGWSPFSIAVVAAGLTLSAGLVVATSMYQAPGRATAAIAASASPTHAKETSRAAASLQDLTPPDLGAQLGEASLPKAAPPTKESAAKDTKPGGFGRLTIRGAAKHKNVYLDEKRLLGSGSRSFTVLCGPHTISINQRHDGRDVDVPCNGELVIDK